MIILKNQSHITPKAQNICLNLGVIFNGPSLSSELYKSDYQGRLTKTL